MILFCPVLDSLILFIVLSCLVPRCAVLIFLFVRIYGSLFCSPAINQTSRNQSKGWFSHILLCRQEKYYWTGLLGLHINYNNMIYIRRNKSHLQFCGKHFLPVGKLIWLDKNTFHWTVETDLKNDFIMYYFLWGPSIVKIVSCFCALVLSICHNRELIIVRPHRT